MTRPKLVVATGNPGKLREIRSMLGDLDVDWRTLADYPDLELPPEGDAYAENAAVKALTAARHTGALAIADDSGLEVAGLGGRPGPHSARYGGPGKDDAARVCHLLAEMEGLEGAERRARFFCIAALATPEGEVTTAEGICPGEILGAPRGDRGFGYDPVFWSTEASCCMAEVSEAEKNRISHRGRAFAALGPALEAALRGR